MKLFIVLSALVALVASHHPLSNEFINEINSKAHSWKAGRNFHLNTDIKVLKKMLSVHSDAHKFRLPEILHDESKAIELPETFDARVKWPKCQSIRDIRDQGGCGSCWAVSSVSSMSDRICIFSNGTDQSYLSAEYVLDCASRTGCNGGSMPSKAFEWWKNKGIVTGGSYDSSFGCQPYQTPPCVSTNTPCTLDIPRKLCQSKCTNPTYNIDFAADKRFASLTYSTARDEKQIKLEILKNGPVTGFFTVYEDFLNYKSGVYQQISGKSIGDHAVRFIGWGVEGGKKYWLVANTWSTQWGDKGFFKILRGQDHLGIESNISAGIPK